MLLFLVLFQLYTCGLILMQKLKVLINYQNRFLVVSVIVPTCTFENDSLMQINEEEITFGELHTTHSDNINICE